MAITPWESWPARLALTQPEATAWASSSDAPAAFSSAAPMRVRRSAWTIGMGFPQNARVGQRVLLVVGTVSSQTGGLRARPESLDRHAVALIPERIPPRGTGPGRPAQEIVKAPDGPSVIGVTFTLRKGLPHAEALHQRRCAQFRAGPS